MEKSGSLIARLGGPGPLAQDEAEVLSHLPQPCPFDGTNFGPSPDLQANGFERAGQGFYEQQDPICAACFRLALRHYVHVEGPTGPRALNCARSLGRCFRISGEPELARDLLAEVLQWQAATQGMANDDTLITSHHLCIALLDMDEPDAAADLLEPAIEASMEVRGADHPLTYILQSLLGDAHRIRGHYDAAMEILEPTLRNLERTLGRADEETLTCMNNLAVVYYTLGRLLDSERLLKEVHEARLASKGSSDPDTITALGNLANIRYQLGDWSEALRMERRALEDRRRVQGDDHPDTWMAMNNLAGTLRMMGDFAEARDLLERVLIARRAKLPLDHYDTLTAEANLADLLRRSGDVARAAALAEHVHAVRSARHEDTHPALQEAKALLAAIRFAQDRLPEAIEIQTVVLKYRIETLGDIHIDTALARNALARMLEKTGEVDRAVEIHEQAVEHAEQALGPQKTDVLDLKMDLVEALHTRGEDDRAGTRALQVAETLATRRELYAADFSVALRTFALLIALDYGEPLRPLFSKVSALMCSTVELRTRADIRSLLGDFNGFHEAWQEICVKRFPEDLPLALLPSQGIESSVEIATSLERSAEPEWKAIIDARKTLASLRAQIAQLDAAGVDGRDLISRERDALLHYDQALENLASATGENSEALRLQPQTSDELVAALAAGEVLVLLWHHPKRGYIASALGHQLRFDLNVDGLEGLREQARHYELQSSTGRGYRSHRSNLDEIGRMNPLEAELLGATIPVRRLRETCNDALWGPLMTRLPATTTLLMVTGPRTHSLPVDSGNPGVNVRYFAGLPSYHAVRRAVAPTDLQALELITNAAWDTHVPIPFVEAEADIVEMLVPNGGSTSPRRALVACHGGVMGDGDYRFPVLIVSAREPGYLGPAHIQRMEPAFTEFYCSACVGGVVSQTSGGDAFGIVSALQRRGAGAVIASSAPLPDFYMPLMSALYWYARSQATTPATALACAKAQLRRGDWPSAVVDAVSKAYVGQVESVLEGVAEISERGLALARTVSGWMWPDALKEAPHVIHDRASHAAFAHAHCESVDRRRYVAHRVTENLLAKRAELPPEIVEHICAFVVCHG